MVPAALHVISIVSLGLGGLCAAIVVVDEFAHPQHTWIMNVVFPVNRWLLRRGVKEKT